MIGSICFQLRAYFDFDTLNDIVAGFPAFKKTHVYALVLVENRVLVMSAKPNGSLTCLSPITGS